LAQKLLEFPEKNRYKLDSKIVKKSNFLIT
jgi:hypothetical protein